MPDLKPDITARISLYSTKNGGRAKAIPAARFGCPFVYDGEAFDCRLLLEQTHTALAPGDCADVLIKFLNPDLVKPRLTPGAKFKLWEGGDFADGEVLTIVN
jgi:hypothetical protein